MTNKTKAMDELIAQDADLIDEDKALVERVAMLQDGNAWPSTVELLCDLRDRIETLSAEIERLKNQLSVETEPSPYCPICGSCGDEGCCGSKRCMYPDTGIEALQADNAKLRAANKVAEKCVVALMEECARYRDEIYAALQEIER